MKRIAFSCEDKNGLNSEMSMHFGRCPFFTLIDVEEGKMTNAQVVANPAFENHVPGAVPEFIRDQKVNVMIAGGMGPKAVNMFNGFGLEVATGVGGKIEKVLEAYLEGKVQGTVPCKHDHGDSCGGH
jgi:predicted Fe-Mo cluster-binding NifX family protein